MTRLFRHLFTRRQSATSAARRFGLVKHRFWAVWWIVTASLFALSDSPNAALVIAFIMMMEQASDLDKAAPSDFEQNLAQLGRTIVRDMMKGHEHIRFTGPGVISQATREAEFQGTTLRITVSAVAKEHTA
ncbi:MAG: hypothetical protein ACK4ZW_08445 [Blastomonas sp.]